MLWSKTKKLKFFGSFCSFSQERGKKEQIQNFYWLIINSLNAASCWQRHWGCSGVEPTPVYPRRQKVQKTSLFQRKLNELSEKVSFDFEFALALEIQPFKVEVAFSVFLKYQFFKVFPGWIGSVKAQIF